MSTDTVHPQSTPREAQESLACPACFVGFITMTQEEDGEERHEAVPCRRCNRG